MHLYVLSSAPQARECDHACPFLPQNSPKLDRSLSVSPLFCTQASPHRPRVRYALVLHSSSLNFLHEMTDCQISHHNSAELPKEDAACWPGQAYRSQAGLTFSFLPFWFRAGYLTLSGLDGGVEFLERHFSEKIKIRNSLLCTERNNALCSLFPWVAILVLNRKVLSKISSLAQMYNDQNLSSRFVHFNQHEQQPSLAVYLEKHLAVITFTSETLWIA